MYDFDPQKTKRGELQCSTEIYVSREGIATLSRIPTAEEHLFIEVHKGILEWDPAQLRPDDSIIERTHYRPGFWDNKRDNINWSHITGQKPEWIDFGWKWMEWVSNPEVQNSAKQYILFKARERWLKDYIRGFLCETNLRTLHDNWSNVAVAMLGTKYGRELYNRQTLNTTSVSALPIKIALRLGGWRQPVRKPVHLDPKNKLIKLYAR